MTSPSHATGATPANLRTATASGRPSQCAVEQPGGVRRSPDGPDGPIYLPQTPAISNQTGANISYLLGDNSASPIDWYNHPYTHKLFDERQAESKRRKQDRAYAAHVVHGSFARAISMLAATVLRFFQDGKEELVSQRVFAALRSVFYDREWTAMAFSLASLLAVTR